MSVPVFPPRLRMLAHVHRWDIMPTLWPDYVSSHSFFVAIYALSIARLIKYTGDTGNLLTVALMHDVDEQATGDINGIVKQAIVDSDKEDAFIAKQRQAHMARLFPLLDGPSSIAASQVVRAADKLDALLYAVKESAFGNGAMARRIAFLRQDLFDAWFDLPAHRALLARLWDEEIRPAIAAHGNSGNYDYGG